MALRPTHPLRLNDYFELKERLRYIETEPQITEVLEEFLSEVTNSENLDESLQKLKRDCQVKAKIFDGSEIVSAPRHIIEKWLKLMNFKQKYVPGLKSSSDLHRGKYEGGFKVWESTFDLIEFLNVDESRVGHTFKSPSEIRCLELGTGCALGTIALLSRAMQSDRLKSTIRIHVQDYNWQVLTTFTMINLGLNLPLDYINDMLFTKRLRLFYGDWEHFRYRGLYHLIIMSEVLYNAEVYESLYQLLARHLKKKGFAIIATKNTYFGLSGGLYQWLDFLRAKRPHIFVYKVIKVSDMNIPRSILVLVKQKSPPSTP